MAAKKTTKKKKFKAGDVVCVDSSIILLFMGGDSNDVLKNIVLNGLYSLNQGALCGEDLTRWLNMANAQVLMNIDFLAREIEAYAKPT